MILKGGVQAGALMYRARGRSASVQAAPIRAPERSCSNHTARSADDEAPVRPGYVNKLGGSVTYSDVRS